MAVQVDRALRGAVLGAVDVFVEPRPVGEHAVFRQLLDHVLPVVVVRLGTVRVRAAVVGLERDVLGGDARVERADDDAGAGDALRPGLRGPHALDAPVHPDGVRVRVVGARLGSAGHAVEPRGQVDVDGTVDRTLGSAGQRRGSDDGVLHDRLHARPHELLERFEARATHAHRTERPELVDTGRETLRDEALDLVAVGGERLRADLVERLVGSGLSSRTQGHRLDRRELRCRSLRRLVLRCLEEDHGVDGALGGCCHERWINDSRSRAAD